MVKSGLSAAWALAQPGEATWSEPKAEEVASGTSLGEAAAVALWGPPGPRFTARQAESIPSEDLWQDLWPLPSLLLSGGRVGPGDPILGLGAS